MPIPARKDIIGPPPESETTYDTYVALVKQCIDNTPGRRPGFSEVVQRLKTILAEELAATARNAATKASSSGSSGAELSVTCVVCLEKPPIAGLVHRQEKM